MIRDISDPLGELGEETLYLCLWGGAVYLFHVIAYSRDMSSLVFSLVFWDPFDLAKSSKLGHLLLFF